MSAEQPPSILRRRGTVLSISAAVIVAAGAYAGAQLKQNVQQRAEYQKRQEETVAERIER